MGRRRGVYERFIKRPMDFLCAVLGLIVFSPIMVIIALLIRVKLGSPVIFKQERPGLNEKIFTLYKFRSMTNQKNKNEELLADEKRLTEFGKWLRSTSIDELPELFNILKGDMSIVGPRPLLVRYLERYNEMQRHRHDVRPGITGYAQINGRNSISWEERFKMDVWYSEHITMQRDLRIISKTIRVVLERKGINSGTSETMEEFMGTGS